MYALFTHAIQGTHALRELKAVVSSMEEVVKTIDGMKAKMSAQASAFQRLYSQLAAALHKLHEFDDCSKATYTAPLMQALQQRFELALGSFLPYITPIMPAPATQVNMTRQLAGVTQLLLAIVSCRHQMIKVMSAARAWRCVPTIANGMLCCRLISAEQHPALTSSIDL
jgi:hypothetical protein